MTLVLCGDRIELTRDLSGVDAPWARLVEKIRETLDREWGALSWGQVWREMRDSVVVVWTRSPAEMRTAVTLQLRQWVDDPQNVRRTWLGRATIADHVLEDDTLGWEWIMRAVPQEMARVENLGQLNSFWDVGKNVAEGFVMASRMARNRVLENGRGLPAELMPCVNLSPDEVKEIVGNTVQAVWERFLESQAGGFRRWSASGEYRLAPGRPCTETERAAVELLGLREGEKGLRAEEMPTWGGQGELTVDRIRAVLKRDYVPRKEGEKVAETRHHVLAFVRDTVARRVKEMTPLQRVRRFHELLDCGAPGVPWARACVGGVKDEQLELKWEAELETVVDAFTLLEIHEHYGGELSRIQGPVEVEWPE